MAVSDWSRRMAVVVCVATILAGTLSGQSRSDWRITALAELCARYVGGKESVVASRSDEWLEKLTAAVGERLAAKGTTGVPAEDLAAVAMLVAERTSRQISSPERVATGREMATKAVTAQPDGRRRTQAGAGTLADIGKGQEGLRQGIERLAEMPVTERLVITGDVTAGVQAATVSGATDLTSTFGRFRGNFVARAMEGTGRLRNGYFFVQLRAAGGPFDTSAVGGPPAYNALNDVAVDRSRYNEGTSRGNLYLAKAFYQQELHIWKGELTARAGVVNFSDFFDANLFANNEARQFLNSSLVNNAAYKAGISAPGLMGEFQRKVERDWLRNVVLRTGYGVSQTARAFTSPLWNMEAEAQTLLRDREGHYRIGGSLGNVAGMGGAHGIYVNFDQWLSRAMGVWGRYGFSNQGPGSAALGPARQAYSGGWQWRISGTGDRISAWGIGFSQTFGMETGNGRVSERALETYYRLQVARNFSLTPDFQLVLGLGGAKQPGKHAVLGLRLYYGF